MALVREMYRSALGEIPLSESIQAGGAPRTARDSARLQSLTRHRSRVVPTPERKERGEGPMRRGGGWQRQDGWVGWLGVGGRGGRSPRFRATVQVRIQVQRVLRLLLPPQLGYEREVRKVGGLRGDWQYPPPSPSGSILPSSPRQAR